MQISSLGSSETLRERALERAPAGGALASSRALATSATAPTLLAAPGALVRVDAIDSADLPKAGVRVWNPERNGQLSSAQQAVQFLDRLGSRLQNLKSDLSSAVAGAPVSPDRLERQRDTLTQLWNSRASQAGGQLDSRLVYSTEAPATQSFAIRGLDRPSLQPTERETLALALGTPTPAHPAALVVVEPGLDGKTLARRFGQALAPLGIDVTVTDQQSLRFAVPESEWPAVRDTLSIRGEGRRFPTGMFHRVRTEAEPAAIAPEAWSLQSGPAGRQTLQRIVEAQGQVGRARDDALAALQQANDDLEAASAAKDAAWARGYAESFAASASIASQDTPDTPKGARYSATFAMGAALPRVTRQRVLNLLSQEG